jgi:uracil-DNA glycosylase
MQDKPQLDLELSPAISSLAELATAENECTRCPLYKDATQAVPGEGRRSAQVMLVGEQPGDKEDLAGKPFVGPAGRVLDRALADAGIPRSEVFVTNAVSISSTRCGASGDCTSVPMLTKSSAARSGSTPSAPS